MPGSCSEISALVWAGRAYDVGAAGAMARQGTVFNAQDTKGNAEESSERDEAQGARSAATEKTSEASFSEG